MITIKEQTEVDTMNTEAEFKRELKDLLGRYQVEINLDTDVGTGSFFPRYTIAFFSYDVYEEGELKHKGIDFSGSYFSGSYFSGDNV